MLRTSVTSSFPECYVNLERKYPITFKNALTEKYAELCWKLRSIWSGKSLLACAERFTGTPGNCILKPCIINFWQNWFLYSSFAEPQTYKKLPELATWHIADWKVFLKPEECSDAHSSLHSNAAMSAAPRIPDLFAFPFLPSKWHLGTWNRKPHRNH